MSGTKSTTYSYYQAICKKKTAKSCKCVGGQPAFGTACKKNGAAMCSKCHYGKLNKAKTACATMFESKDKIYMTSYSGQCPKGYSFVNSNFNECKDAFKVLKAGKVLTTRVYKTTSRGYPMGCSYYARYSRGYFAGEGRTNYNYQGYGYYKAVCRKNSLASKVKLCSCNHGEAPHGKACPKHGMAKCTSCHRHWKMNKAKTACVAPENSVYVMSKTGLCPKSHDFLTGSKSECEYASKLMNLRDKTAYTTSSTAIPVGCSYYYGGSLYFAPKGTKSYGFNYYHAICKKRGAKECVCANGAAAVGNACPKNKALACKSCNVGYRLSNDKKNCNALKLDYTASTNAKCPKGFMFLEGSKYECQDAAKALGLKDKTAYHTASTYIPRGCSYYNTNALYWAPLGSKTSRYNQYKVICKKATAKHCVCKNGHASHGKECPKNKALSCKDCDQGWKLNSKKTNCDKPTTKTYVWSGNGKCPKGFAHLTSGGTKECSAAGKLLYIKDKTARSYRSNFQPAGCYQYTSGAYADLRMNAAGRSNYYTSTYYRAICKTTGGKQCKCPNGTPSHGSACSGNGKGGCSKCNPAYELDKAKTKCTHVKSDYTYSSGVTCPKGFKFLTGSGKECEAAAKSLKLKDQTAYGTTSTYIPRGCSYYNGYSLYFAPRGSLKSRSGYYKAICKKSTANDCVCPNGSPAHGKDCPKNRAMKCMSCDSGFKLNSKKTNCDKVTSKLYELSRNGLCPQKAHIADSIASCNKAAKTLSLKDTSARKYTSNFQPKGCFLYVSGSYIDLRYNSNGVTTQRSTLYKAVCHHKDQKVCSCPNGHPVIGAGCSKKGAKKCATCNPFFLMNKAKTACEKVKDKDYVLSGTGKCPSTHVFLEGGQKECEYAAARLRSPDTTAYGTSSTYIPRGCSYYYGGSLYYAPRGTTGYRSSYYKAICKHKGAKQCVCPHGNPAHGNACAKNKAQACASCDIVYKLAKDKKTCIKVNPWKYMLSTNGKCPKAVGKKKFVPLKASLKACNAAAAALSLPDKTARSYTSNYQPVGCYLYKSGSYHDLRYNSKGRTTGTSTLYRSICLNTVKEETKSPACKVDYDKSGKVDVEDLLELLGVYGKKCTKANICGKGNIVDANGDKKVDVEDLLLILGNYGKKC
eukprot:COSAG05_NODE_1457_length_4829_cov_5.942495_2_plen_1142_part_00